MDQFTVLLHTSPRRNLRSIFAHGIQPHRAPGKLKVVWLTERRLAGWARSHVAKRHQVLPCEVAVLEVCLPVQLVRRARPGVFVCPRLIPASCITAASAAPGRWLRIVA
jgi:hypothetical protein